MYFSYKKDGNYVLKDISFSLRRGEHIAMVGMNGSGKTTCFNWLVKPILKNLKDGEVMVIFDPKGDYLRGIWFLRFSE